MKTKKQLAIMLSKLKVFEKPDTRLEQYPTDSEIAAEIIWWATYKGDITGKVIVDLGSGTGILGLSALAMGAKKVFFVDIDEKALEIAKENLVYVEKELGQKLGQKAEFVNKNVLEFEEKADVVMQNPPFGIQGKRHADKEFLDQAFKIAPLVYSLHKAESQGFIKSFSDDKGYETTHYWEFKFPIKMTMKHHKKKIQRVPVGCWRIQRQTEK